MVLRDSKVRQRKVSYGEQSSLNTLCYCVSWWIFRVEYLQFLQKMSVYMSRLAIRPNAEILGFLLLILLEVLLHSLENRILWFCLLRLHKALYILFERENAKWFFIQLFNLTKMNDLNI